MKDVREDLVSIAAVLAVPLVFAAAFPREAVRFAASAGGGSASSPAVSIVFPDSASVARAMRSTRILSRRGGGGNAGAGLLTVELPEADLVPMMPVGLCDRPKAPTVLEGGIPPFLPSRRAAAPVRIPAAKRGDSLPFPRQELLKLN